MIKVMIGDIGLEVDFAVSDATDGAEATIIRAEEEAIYSGFMRDVSVFADLVSDANKLAEFREHLESAVPEDFAPGEADSDE